MLSEHKPIGKQDFFTKIDVELDDYSSEAAKLIYQKGIFNLIVEHYEYVSSLKLDYYNKYAWVPGSGRGGGYYRTLNDEEKENIHNAKAEIINRLRKRQKPWSNASVTLVSDDAQRETLTPYSIITSWNANIFKNDLNLTLLEKKMTPASDEEKCDKGEYIYTWDKDPTVQISFYMGCIEPNKASQDQNFVPNNFMISIKQVSQENPEIKARKEQEKKE
ncbi:hypothetical protein [Commensalibacter oyaizuii]|uniref:Uncharacterized protein n=1 Tax=Commensalibacter oyaizuii TaxID=3043873 RepID=A0ABT6Q3W8_9PROT|nr:hypothetical protein [Commensalibacter sp. TBRC 16381]MDI2091813.1 hypothetical protein [Commensalibacter sp. TBRC 16381]